MESTKDPQKIIEYFNKALPKYKRHHKQSNARLDRMKAALSKMVSPETTILDVGCGVGVISEHLANIGAIVTGIDIAPDLIAFAKEHASHKNITYFVGNVVDIDLNQRFDVILLSDVLEHLPKKDIFNSILRLTKYNTHTNTVIVVEVPDANFIKFMEENYPEKLQIIDNGYTIDYIVSLFEYRGFIPLRISIHGLDTDCQYNNYIFITRDRINNHYGKRLVEIYKEK